MRNNKMIIKKGGRCAKKETEKQAGKAEGQREKKRGREGTGIVIKL